MNRKLVERSCSTPTGYQMLRSIAIKNFRGFKSIDVKDCRRVNILVGANGSGKTALLEALFLAAGASPELAMRTRAWRGVESERASGSAEDILRAMFRDLFHRFETKNSAVISLKGEDKRENRSLTVAYHPQGQQKIVPAPRNRPGAPPRMTPERTPIEFVWRIEGSIVFKAEPTLSDGRLNFPSAPEWIIKGNFFASHRLSPSIEVANRFSTLSRTFSADAFITKFSELYPIITDLSVEVDSGGPMIFAKVGNLPEMIPLSLASGGMSKLASILVTMAAIPGSVILIDEIENGLYYKQMPKIWRVITEFAREYNCQIFASTHSAECLKAAAPLADENPEDFGVIHTYLKDGESKVLSYGGDKFADALADDIEIR